jgi:hypothetical protein
VAAVQLEYATTYDPNDFFGVRRALSTLPEARRDEFFERWIVLTEECLFEVPRMLAHVRREAIADRATAGREDLGRAWITIGNAIAGYLAWRARL